MIRARRERERGEEGESLLIIAHWPDFYHLYILVNVDWRTFYRKQP